MKRALLALAACGGASTRRGVPSSIDGERSDSVGPVFAVMGNDAAPTVFERRGARGVPVRYVFRREASPTVLALHAVTIERSFAYAVGDGGIALRRTHDGPWQREETGTDAALYGLAIARSQVSYEAMVQDPRAVPILAVGERGTILRRDAAGTWAAEPSSTTADLRAIATTGKRAIAVGDHGTVVCLHDGAWRTVPAHTNATLRSIAASEYAAVIVGEGGTIIECTFPANELACVPRPTPTTTDLGIITERTVRWDSGNSRGFTLHELEAFATDGGRLRRAATYPIELALGPVAPFVVRGYASQHWSFDVAQPEDVAVGDHGALALVDPAQAAVANVDGVANPSVLPELAAHGTDEAHAFEVMHLADPIDLHAVTFAGLDGFVVGDHGAILLLTVEGARIPLAIDL